MGKWSGVLGGDENHFNEFAKVYLIVGINGLVLLNTLIIALHFGFKL